MAICDSSSESWIADFGCVHEFTTQPEDTPGAEASEAADICEITRSELSTWKGLRARSRLFGGAQGSLRLWKHSEVSYFELEVSFPPASYGKRFDEHSSYWNQLFARKNLGRSIHDRLV